MLREKQDELSRLLLSRKRKLSELYYATVGLGDLRTTVDNTRYKEKERLFLDANDLSKGRLFDISTLPPRPLFVRPTKPETSLQTSHHTLNVIHTTQQSNSESTSPQPNGGPSPKSLTGSSGRLTPPIRADGGRKIDVDGERGTENEELLGVIAIGTSSDVNPISHALEEQTGVEVATNGSSEQRNEELRYAGKPLVEIGDHLEALQAAHELRPDSSFQKANPEEPARNPSPVMAALISTTADPQSSPASTNGAGSTNTPDAVAGSPTTSPGDEHGPDELNTVAGGLPREANSDADSPIHPIHKPRLKLEPPDDAVTPQPPTKLGPDSAPRPLAAAVTGRLDSAGTATFTARKPNMRIDTNAATTSTSRPNDASHVAESPMTLSSAFTPRRGPGSASFSLTQSPPGRITRITSGTIRPRSVSEILGEAPKPPSPALDKSSAQSFFPTPVRETFGGSTLSARLADRKELEKDRSKLSTVVFAKPKGPLNSAHSTEALRNASGEAAPFAPEERDYLHTLFESKAHSPPRGQSLNTLLQSAHKTLSTADHLIDHQEQLNCRTLKRIYQLQNVNRWPLRQMGRAPEPVRQTSQWDFLLDHAKWIRTDFREERKWKIAAARGVAHWCAEWVASSPRRRQQLQVRARPPQLARNISRGADVRMEDCFGIAISPAQQTPGFVPLAEHESLSDENVSDMMDLRHCAVPAAIFALGSSEFNFPMSKTPAMDKLLSELPYYEPARIEPDLSHSDLAERSDSRWKTDIIPISRYAIEKVRYRPPQAPSKRSRYDYEEDDWSSRNLKPLSPEQNNVALFMPENKHIRDRIHPGHSFRPPSEYTMPAQAFFESRSSSLWTQIEDDELRKLVKDYSYNWSLISSCLSTNSPFHSGADRRTPWECFERWINLEGLPADMSKTPYFRTYHSRIEAAGRHVIAQQEALQGQGGGNPALTPRRRTSQPVRIERKKNQKHLAMLDAMRKLAKKRETALQKQQHAADLAAMRKANEADRPRPPYNTPAEFSRLKHEREVKLAERQEIYRLQVLAQQKAAMQQRTAQMNQANGLTSGSARSNLPHGSAGVSSSNMQNALLGVVGPSHQARPQPGMQRLPNGATSNNAFSVNMGGTKGLTQAQMQVGLAAGRGLGHSPERMRVLYEANRLQQQQQLMLAARQQHQQQQQQGSSGSTGQQSSPNMANGAFTGSNGNSNSPAFLAALAANNGVPSPSAPGGQGIGVDNADSPRLPNGHPLSSCLMPGLSQLAASIRRQHPEMLPDEIQRLATSQLTVYRQHAAQNMSQKSMNQAALNAAAGAVNAGAHAANANSYGRPQVMMTNDQVQAYNLQLREQQATQRGNGGYGVASLNAGLAMDVNGTMGGLGGMAAFTGSPVLNVSRPVSNHVAQGQVSRSATPREQRCSSSGGMAQSSPRGGQAQM